MPFLLPARVQWAQRAGVFVMAFLGCAALAHAQASPRTSARTTDSLSWRISLITVGPGSALFSWLGHSALLVVDPRTGTARLFDYGVVNPGPATTRGLLTGNLLVNPVERDARARMAVWSAAGRTIAIQELDLSSDQLARLAVRLYGERNGQSSYRYDPQFDNCSTRIRDLLDEVTDGALRRVGVVPTGLTVREIGTRLVGRRWVTAALGTVFNDAIDHPASRWDAAAYPAELSQLIADVKVTASDGLQHPLVSHVVRPAVDPTVGATPYARFRLTFLLLGIGLAAIALLIGHAAALEVPGAKVVLGLWTALVGGTLGLCGAILSAGWLFTQYSFARYNENILVLNPLLLAAVPLGVWYARGAARAGRPLYRALMLGTMGTVIAIVLKAAPGLGQDNWSTLLLACPTVAGLTAGVLLAERRIVLARSGRRNHPPESIDLPNVASARIASTHALPWSLTR